METNVNYTAAGTFVIIFITLIVFGIIWLSAGFSREKYTYYKVQMIESVSGLSRDGPVEFNGVNVGTVAEMKISRKNPQVVYLLLKVKESTPVTLGTRAKLGMKALTGVAYMLLEDKGKDMRPLEAKEGQEYPIIPTTPSILVRLDTTLTQLTDSFQQLSTSVKSLLSKENLIWVGKILQSGQHSMHMLETRTLPATNETFSNMESITRDLSSVSSEMKENPAILIRGKTKSNKLGPGEK